MFLDQSRSTFGAKDENKMRQILSLPDLLCYLTDYSCLVMWKRVDFVLGWAQRFLEAPISGRFVYFYNFILLVHFKERAYIEGFGANDTSCEYFWKLVRLIIFLWFLGGEGQLRFWHLLLQFLYNGLHFKKLKLVSLYLLLCLLELFLKLFVSLSIFFLHCFFGAAF